MELFTSTVFPVQNPNKLKVKALSESVLGYRRLVPSSAGKEARGSQYNNMHPI